MFQFTGCPPIDLWIQSMVTGRYPRRVPPFGYPRICARLQLPEAFRSWPRPSSASGAMASTLRSSSLDFFVAIDPETIRIEVVPHSLTTGLRVVCFQCAVVKVRFHP